MRKLGYVLVALLAVRAVHVAYVAVRVTVQTRLEDDDVILKNDDDDEEEHQETEEPYTQNRSHGYVPGLAAG